MGQETAIKVRAPSLFQGSTWLLRICQGYYDDAAGALESCHVVTIRGYCHAFPLPGPALEGVVQSVVEIAYFGALRVILGRTRDLVAPEETAIPVVYNQVAAVGWNQYPVETASSWQGQHPEQTCFFGDNEIGSLYLVSKTFFDERVSPLTAY